MILICCWCNCCVQTSTFQTFFKYRISGILCHVMNQYAFNIYYIVDSHTRQYQGNALLRSMATVFLRTVPILRIKICLVLKSRVGQYTIVILSWVNYCHTTKQTNLIWSMPLHLCVNYFLVHWRLLYLLYHCHRAAENSASRNWNSLW